MTVSQLTARVEQSNDITRQMREQAPPDGLEAAPDPDIELARFARRIYRERRVRRQSIDPCLLGEPAWDMLLDLYASAGEGTAVNISSACIASDAPATTALRYLSTMVKKGLVERIPATVDHRVSYVRLSAEGRRQMAYLLRRMMAVGAAPCRADEPPCRGEPRPS